MNPKTWNRYAYALNNPLSRVDPNGECSQPSGLQPGQIGVCIDLYIAGPTVGVNACPVLCGLGDNRGPDPNGGTFRVEIQIIYDPQTPNDADVTVNTAASTVEILEMEVSAPGTSTGVVQAIENSDGSTTVSIVDVSFNGFSALPGWLGAPTDPILLATQLTFTPEGQVTVDGGDRSAFPSLEMWAYESGEDAVNILALQETNESDLGFNNVVPIPTTGVDLITQEQPISPPEDVGEEWDGGEGDDDSWGLGGGGGGRDDCGEDCFDSARLFYKRPFLWGPQRLDFPPARDAMIVHVIGFSLWPVPWPHLAAGAGIGED